MAILLTKLAAAVKEYDRTQPERDVLWEAVLAYPNNREEYRSEKHDQLYRKYKDAEESARRKLGEAMWAEPTNTNSYDKCVDLVDISIARKWITTTVKDHEKWRKKYGRKFEEHQENLRKLTGGISANQAAEVDNISGTNPTRKSGRTKNSSRKIR